MQLHPGFSSHIGAASIPAGPSRAIDLVAKIEVRVGDSMKYGGSEKSLLHIDDTFAMQH